jgi:hypothetical protein
LLICIDAITRNVLVAVSLALILFINRIVGTIVDVNPLGFMPDLSMRDVRDNSIGGDDVHGPTTTFPRMHLSNRYTTSYGCCDLVERVNRH